MRTCAAIAAILALASTWLAAGEAAQPQGNPAERDVTQGALRIVTKEGGVVECPLKHTDVRADVSGFIARVKVTQTFHNPLDEKIEAIYVFPLPHKAAVDDMTMVIGERRIVGLIKRRAAAREIYEQALVRGLTAALLEQERPNIFTQSVGNIPPKQEVKIEISYVDVLEYDMGVYEFHFPMVVGPRYIPGSPTSSIPPVPPELKGKVGELDKTKVPEGKDKPKGTGWAPDTTRVPDASRITPPVLKPGVRNGHDISLAVWLNAGVPIQDLKVANHKAEVERDGVAKAAVALSRGDTIPNKDFVLRYGVVGAKPEMALLCHTHEAGKGYFMLMVQPKEDERLKVSPPREIVFLVDVSGSMGGQPTAKVRETMAKLLRLCKPNDTVQLVVFASQAAKLFEKPVPANEENIKRTVNFTQGLRGGGGTEMLKGVKMAINEPLDQERLRIVIMLTDGYIGNEAEIIAEVGRSCGDKIRFWAIGIGSSPNRFLIDGVARQGGGMAKVLGLNDETEPMAVEIMQRIHRAQLANITVDWGQADVFETYPAKVPELWAGRPVVLFGRYGGGSQTTLTLSGDVEGKPAKWTLPVKFVANAPENGVLAQVWARNKIEELMQQTFYAGSPEVEEEVTQLALDYRLMSQYTSFVAVDEAEAGKLVEPARPPRRMLVPIPIPEGTRYEGFFGDQLGAGHGWDDYARTNGRVLRKQAMASAKPMYAVPPPPVAMPVAPAERKAGAALATEGEARSRRGFAYGGAGSGYRRAVGLDKLEERAESAGPAGDADRETTSIGRVYGWRALSAQLGKHGELATKRLAEAEELRKKGDLYSARSRFAFAYLADAALQACGMSGGQTASKAAAAIEEIDRELLKVWTKDVPELEKRLDLVLRDKSVEEALEAIARAAGISVKPIVGSVQDAAALVGERDLRVSFLDLRRATVAQALNWLLVPNRLSWWVAKGSAVVGSARRAAGESAWVYNVSAIAIPSAKELDGIKEYPKRVEAVGSAAGRFLKAVQAELKLTDDTALWFAPGQLLVFGDTKAHIAARSLLTQLASPHSQPKGDLAALYKDTAPRAREHEAAAAAREAAEAKARLVETLPTHGWALLAAAVGGTLDLEALTELQIAWRDPAMAELLKGRSVAAARALWAIAESARALPREGELAPLAAAARAKAREVAEAALADLAKSPGGDPAAFFRALYAALACRDDAALADRAHAVLTTGGAAGSSVLQVGRALAAALLASANDADPKVLVELVCRRGNEVRGDDLVALTAFACRRVGGQAWRAFRAEARDLLGRQPLDGNVVVFVNRLARPAVQLAAR
ncbi:MAG TPA: VIT domain-containing protein [Planctomycetota bacterium]|nr:VIT domain-containing protein [Planctomycetota bacterium]